VTSFQHQDVRALGTMVAYGFPDRDLGPDLAIAARLGARVLEIFPDWRSDPDPAALRSRLLGEGFSVHSAHGCWGGQSIRAPRVDLGDPDPTTRRASVDDLRRCVEWLSEAGGTCLVVHPGGLSDSEQAGHRGDALAHSLGELADHARGTGVVLCVENMPPGVHPGSRMADVAAVVARVGRDEVALAVDTGHANIVSSAAAETLDAGDRLRTTHLHDNDGRQDTHLPPGLGTVDWGGWAAALDTIGYRGPVMLECIRHFRKYPETIDDALLTRLGRMTTVRPR
jgi:sugar phosphate isomerase/epimerase